MSTISLSLLLFTLKGSFASKLTLTLSVSSIAVTPGSYFVHIFSNN